MLNNRPFKYTIIIWWSAEDDAFIAEVPDLPGCVADGKTYAEAVTNAEVVIGEWIETAKVQGRTIPEPVERDEIDRLVQGFRADSLETDGIEWTRLSESSLAFWHDEEEDIYADLV